MRTETRRRRIAALGALIVGAAIVAPAIAIATASSTAGAATQDKIIFVQKSGQQKTGPYVEYEGANGTNVTQSLTLSSGSCASSTLSNPASPLLPITAVDYPNGYTKASTPATVGSSVVSGVAETGVCVNQKTSPGWTIQPGEGLDFSIGSNSDTSGRLFSEATIPLKNNNFFQSTSGDFVLRRLENGVETTVDTVPFTLPAGGKESPGDLTDCGPISTGVVPAADQFDQLEIQVSSSSGSASVVGPNCDNDNDADDQAVPTFYLDSAPVITSANNATFVAGTSGSFPVTATGYPTPTFTNAAFPSTGTPTCTPSTLPSGLTFTDNGNGTATIAGSPWPTTSAGGSYTYTLCINASNDAGTATQTFTLTIDQTPAITSADTTTFTVGSLGTFTVTTTGNPAPALSDTCASSLPSGVTFVDNGNGTATISGTPNPITTNNNPNGVYTFQVCISASNTINGTTTSVTQAFSLVIDQAPAITSEAAASFTSGNASLMNSGTPGTFTVTTTGNPAPAITNAAFPSTGPPFTCTPSALPTDVMLTDNGNGTATIDYTAANDSVGTYTLCLNATNSAGTATQTFTLTIQSAPAITSLNNVIVPVGEPFSFEVTTTGYPPPSLSDSAAVAGCTPDLPSDLSSDASFFVDNGDGTATISGTPGSGDGGTWTVCITASNGVGSPATQAFSLIITSPSAPLEATNDSSDGVTASLQVNSGSKSFTDFTTAGTAGGASSVTFETEGTSTYTATLDIDWGDLAYCVPYASSSPPTCSPTSVTFDVGDVPTTQVVEACLPNNTPPDGNSWCSESSQYSYVTIGSTEYTNITETITGSGDLTFNHP